MHLRAAPCRASRQLLRGFRRRATPSADVSWPRLPGGAIGVRAQPGKESVVKKPAENMTLSAAEGEAIIARLSVYAPSRSDCEMLIQVLRWYFWLAAAVKEAKLSLKKLRTLLFGPGPKPPTRCEPEASSVSASSRGDGEVSGDGSARDEEGGRSAEAGSRQRLWQAAETSKPRGGHRPGTGRLGAEAYTGAERVECRHEELAVGQRCPVCGQGTLYALPAWGGDAHRRPCLAQRHTLRVSKAALLGVRPDFYGGTARGRGGRRNTAHRPVPSWRWAAICWACRCTVSQAYQAMLGVPVPDATQWDQIEQVGDCAYMVFAQMEHGGGPGRADLSR